MNLSSTPHLFGGLYQWILVKSLHLPSSLATWLEYASLRISRSPLSRFRPLLWLARPSSLMILGFAFLPDWLPLKSLFLMQAVSTFFVDCFSPLCHLFDTCGFSLNWGCPPLVSQSRYQVSPPLIKDRSPTCIIFLMNCGFALSFLCCHRGGRHSCKEGKHIKPAMHLRPKIKM